MESTSWFRQTLSLVFIVLNERPQLQNAHISSSQQHFPRQVMFGGPTWGHVILIKRRSLWAVQSHFIWLQMGADSNLIVPYQIYWRCSFLCHWNRCITLPWDTANPPERISLALVSAEARLMSDRLHAVSEASRCWRFWGGTSAVQVIRGWAGILK